MAFEFIDTALSSRKQQQLFRHRYTIESAMGVMIEIEGQHYLNFSSNDYLGLRRSSIVAQAWIDGISEFAGGSGASPLVTGYTQAHQDLEEYLAKQLKRDKVLLFNSGFAANQALCQGLFAKDKGAIFADKLIHASFVDGAQASGALFKRFRHNDLSHLRTLLDQTKNQQHKDLDKLVATESVFSMDGDEAPIIDLLPVLEAYDAWLMVDDAHGFGVLGENGLGICEQYALSQQQLPILMATFGKAIGTAGAFIAGSEGLINYLINFAKHYIYSTAMPAAQAHATLVSIKANCDPKRRQLLQARISQFKQLAMAAKLPLLPSNTAIQPILVGDAHRVLNVSEKLRKLGLWVSAIRYPTVPKGTDRLRITLSAEHHERDIVAIVDALQIVFSSLGK